MTKKSPSCDTCGNEGVVWLLSPCPDCKEGKKVKQIGKGYVQSLKSLNKVWDEGFEFGRDQTLLEVEKIIDEWMERPSNTPEAKAVDNVLIFLKEEIKKLKEVGKK